MTAPRAARLIRVWVPLLLAAGVAWLATAYLATRMDPMMPVTAMGPAFFVLAWLPMMAAMMLPSVAPVAQAWLRMIARQERRRVRRVARTVGFLAGYLVAWTAVAVPAYALAVGLDRLGDRDQGTARLVTAGLLGVAGLYQFTPLKQACLRHCRSPVSSLLHYAALRGPLLDLRVGLRHAGYCIGCCWGLMAALVLLGAMNLWLMALLAVVIFAEKIWRYGYRFSQAVGGVLALLGVAALAGAPL
ncbi:MAG TPA: DUF2182 domain-containing protein [Micromonosporaceae bacterium]